MTTKVNDFHFAAYSREANKNPTLGLILNILRERYPNLASAAAG